MTKPGPTETRVRVALLRLFKRCGEDEFSWPSSEVREEVHRDCKRIVGADTVGGIGRKMAHGRWTELSDGVEATYERGVFRVRKLDQARGSDDERAGVKVVSAKTATGALRELSGVPRGYRRVRAGMCGPRLERDPNATDEPEIKNRNPLETPDDRDYSIQVTWTLGRPTALVTVRAKDQDLTAPQLRSFAAALLEAAEDIESAKPRKKR